MTIRAEFLRLVNMRPEAIRAWARDPRAHCYSQLATIRRLPKLAALRRRAARVGYLPTPAEVRYMRKVVGFIKRHKAQVRTQGCTEGRAVALRNWGHAACAVPATCTRARRKR